MPGRSIPNESANSEGPTRSQVPSNTPPRRLIRTRRSEPTLPSRLLGHASSALEPHEPLPTSSRSFHQLPSHPSRNVSPSADSRVRTWRNDEIEASPTLATESSQDQNPSPTGSVGPWESISRVGTPPPDHPSRHPRRMIYVISEVPCIAFKCLPPRTDEEHRVQLENAEKHMDRIQGHIQRFKRLMQESDGDLKAAFNGFAGYLALFAQIHVYMACLKRSRESKDDIWEQLRQFSAGARCYTRTDYMMDWSESADYEEKPAEATSKPSDTQNNS